MKPTRLPYVAMTLTLTLLLQAVCGCATIINGAPAGKDGAAAIPPPPTLWQFLGVPQTVEKTKAHAAATRVKLGAALNASGNFPGLEVTPPILPLTAPGAEKSEVPAVASAAAIKAKQDAAAQTIKSIRYLAKVGCGCFDEDGSVTLALFAGLENCVEEVRYETVKAISEITGGNCCTGCNGSSCCNDKIVNKLREMAHEQDKYGCAKEPSARVRRKAVIALKTCHIIKHFEEPPDETELQDKPDPEPKPEPKPEPPPDREYASEPATEPEPPAPQPPEGREYAPDTKAPTNLKPPATNMAPPPRELLPAPAPKLTPPETTPTATAAQRLEVDGWSSRPFRPALSGR